MKDKIWKVGVIDGQLYTIEWELKNNRHGKLVFSMSGNVWNKKRTDIVQGGQCIDEIVEAFSDQEMTPEARKQLLSMHNIWKEWHLNDCRAGSPRQHQHLRENPVGDIRDGSPDVTAYLDEKVEIYLKGKEILKDGKVFTFTKMYDPETGEKLPKPEGYTETLPEIRAKVGRHLSHYDIAKWKLKKAGLEPDTEFSDPGTAPKPYSYGSSWLHEDLPAEVIAEIESWQCSPQDEKSEWQAWLEERYKISVMKHQGSDRYSDEYHARIEHVVPKKGNAGFGMVYHQGKAYRKDMKGRPWSEKKERNQVFSTSFNFSPAKSAPDIVRLVEAICVDVQSYLDYSNQDDFIQAFGYGDDRRKGRRVFEDCRRQYEEARDFFGSDFHKIMED